MNQNILDPTYCFFDVETTGKKAEYDRIVQIAAILTDSKGKELRRMNFIIKPDEFLISNSHIHGITQERALKEGVELRDALTVFLVFVSNATYLVAHNFIFDFGFVAEELNREGMKKDARLADFYKKKSYCTMRTTTDFCKLSWNEKYKQFKWPRLEELHWKLFGEGFDGAHNALNDVWALVRSFFELKSKHGFYAPGTSEKESGYSNRNLKS